MRFLREALSAFGLRRSNGVIEPMMASWRPSTSLSRSTPSSCFLILPMPGSRPMTPDMPPSFCSCFSCSARSSRSNAPFFMRAAIFFAFSASMVSAAFSTRLTTSPMPRMRLAMRSGWKSSSPSSFSPVPRSLIGLPVTARMESAAPPRPSPSTRVSTMPVTPIRSLKARATFTASWPVRLSATSSVSCGPATSRTASTSAISSSSMWSRPAVSSITTS